MWWSLSPRERLVFKSTSYFRGNHSDCIIRWAWGKTCGLPLFGRAQRCHTRRSLPLWNLLHPAEQLALWKHNQERCSFIQQIHRFLFFIFVCFLSFCCLVFFFFFNLLTWSLSLAEKIFVLKLKLGRTYSKAFTCRPLWFKRQGTDILQYVSAYHDYL